MYHDLAEQELHHASVEHDNVARIIHEEKERGNEAPDAMKAVWDWEHRKALEDEIEIRTMIAKYLR